MTARWITRWKPAVGFEFLGTVGDKIVELGLDIGHEVAAELLDIDVACTHHRAGILVVDQREQQMLEGRIFMVPLIGKRERPVERLFQTTRECWHQSLFVL